MAGIYRRLLERIARNPHAVLEGRMSLPGSEKALVAAQALAGFDRWKYRKGPARGSPHQGSAPVKVVVIGGGLAGITAAVALAKAKHEVTLLEAKPRLGGATMSFNRDGLVIDTGQHVFLRCCTAYRGLLDRLGMAAHAPLQPRFDVTVLAPGKRAVMKRRRVPAPLHMLPALLGYPFLNTAGTTSACPGRARLPPPQRGGPRRRTSSASATGSRPTDRTSGPGACSGTCSPSPR